ASGGRQPRPDEVGDSLMDPSRPDRILEDWAEVAQAVRRPAIHPKRVGVRVAPGTSIAGAGVLLAAVLLVAVWVGRPGSNGGIGAVASPAATDTPTATATQTPAPTPTPFPTPTSTASPTLSQGPRPCAATNLAARITGPWGGAAGN